MTLTSIAPGRCEHTTRELLRAVDGMRPFVLDRMRGRMNEVDTALQKVRETVWKRAHTYDAALGSADSFVFGITRHVVRRELERRIKPVEELDEEVPAIRVSDPLQWLVSRYDSHRWMSLVADLVEPEEWALLTEVAFEDGSTSCICERHNMTPRAFRTVREHVAQVVYTVRAALAAADADLPLTGTVLLRCIPAACGLREVASMLEDDSATIAARLGIHPGSARARKAAARRLIGVAHAVLARELAA